MKTYGAKHLGRDKYCLQIVEKDGYPRTIGLIKAGRSTIDKIVEALNWHTQPSEDPEDIMIDFALQHGMSALDQLDILFNYLRHTPKVPLAEYLTILDAESEKEISQDE